MKRITAPMSDFSKWAVCTGSAIAAIGLYLTVLLPLIATTGLSYVIGAVVDIFQVLGVSIAFIAALPYLIKLGLYYLWTPEIHVLYPGSPGHLNIVNKSSKLLKIEFEFIFRHGNPSAINRLLQAGNGHIVGNMVRGIEDIVPPNTLKDPPYELELPVTVRMHPIVHLSEFGCPTFYGDVELKTIERTLSLDKNGNLSESDEEWVEKRYGTTEGIAKHTRDDNGKSSGNIAIVIELPDEEGNRE